MKNIPLYLWNTIIYALCTLSFALLAVVDNKWYALVAALFVTAFRRFDDSERQYADVVAVGFHEVAEGVVEARVVVVELALHRVEGGDLRDGVLHIPSVWM